MRKDTQTPYYNRTGGHPVNQVLVTQENKAEEPDVFAYIMDAEDDIMRLSFNSEGFTISTEDIKHISGDKVFLKNLTRLSKGGAEVVDHIHDEMEAQGFGEDGVDMPDFSYLVTPARPQNENGEYIPVGAEAKAPKNRLIDRAVAQSSVQSGSFVSDPHGPGHNIGKPKFDEIDFGM